MLRPPIFPLFPYTTLFRSLVLVSQQGAQRGDVALQVGVVGAGADGGAERVRGRNEVPAVDADDLRRGELRLGHADADVREVVDARPDCVEVLRGARLVPGAGGDAGGVVEDGVGGAVR